MARQHGDCDYMVVVKVAGRPPQMKPAGNLAEQAVKLAMEEADFLTQKSDSVALYSAGKWTAEFGYNGWINTVRPMRQGSR